MTKEEIKEQNPDDPRGHLSECPMADTTRTLAERRELGCRCFDDSPDWD